jgi:hypothetical protein
MTSCPTVFVAACRSWRSPFLPEFSFLAFTFPGAGRGGTLAMCQHLVQKAARRAAKLDKAGWSGLLVPGIILGVAIPHIRLLPQCTSKVAETQLGCHAYA